MRWMGFSVPRFLYSQTKAYKRIVEGKYEFGVALSYRFLGRLSSIAGCWRLELRMFEIVALA